jgi:hypothetical protein
MIMPSAPMISIAEVALQAQHVAHHQLRDVRRPGRRAAAFHAQRRDATDLGERVQLRETLPDRGIVGLAELAREAEQPLGREQARPRPCRRCGSGRRSRRLACRAARLRAGERVARRAGAAGAEAGALRHERGVRDRPAVVEATDDVVVVHARVVDEHLVEHGAAGHLPQRADLDAGLVSCRT